MIQAFLFSSNQCNKYLISMLSKIKIVILLILIGQLTAGYEDLYELALREYQAGRYKEAREILLKKTEKKAGDFNLLGWIELKLRNFQEAEEAFLKSLKLKPDLADSYAGLGYVFFQKGDLLAALSFFEKGLTLDEKNETCSEGKAIVERVLKEKSKVDTACLEKNYFFARGDYFWWQKNGDEPSPLFIKGVNIGFALPGNYPSEFPEDEKLYLEWLRLIAEMGANTVRVYTILPPAFYRAFYRHNSENSEEKKLFLIQGIWVELPEKAEFRNEHYLAEIKNEIKNAVDVIHGQARIEPRYGHAHGQYEVDISPYVLAFIFGREWEPGEVIAFNEKNREAEYNGEYLAITEGNAFEIFLTEMLDYLIAYEDKIYKIQRPVALVNWPTLDPLFHPSEATLMEEVEIRKKLGEKTPPYDFSRAWDEDAVSVDETRIRAKPNFRAGLFVAYHVYPYYPDFMRNEEKYALPLKTEGSIYYGNYLRDLKAHYRNRPLLIAEFGLPTSRGIARFHPEGLNQGGLSEEEQAEGLKRLFLNITERGCAGGLVFSWIDEWWKASWITRKYEDNDPLWYNAEDPEENYGLLAMLPARAEKKLRGDPEAWSETQILYYPEDEILKALSVDSDEGYLYLKLDLKKELDWRKRAILLAIDTYGDEEGDHLLPFNLEIISPVGFEFVALLHGKNSQLLVDDTYSKYIFKPELARLPGLTGFLELEREEIGPRYNLNGIFNEIIAVHRRRFSREGKIFGEKIYKASPLIEGRDFCYFKEKALIELRLPWGLLNFLDPSRKKIIYFNENKRTEGIRFLSLSYQPRSETDPLARVRPAEANIQKTMELMKTRYYRWPEWTRPSYQMKPKRSYYALKELFQQIEKPTLKINLPDNFNFNFVISLAYKSKDEFLKNYSQQMFNLQPTDFQDYYGYALACLIRGIISGQTFYILEAKNILSFLASSSCEPREREISGLGVKYMENLLEGNFASAGQEKIEVFRIESPKEKIREKGQKLVLGKSFIKIKCGAIIKSQVDRVTRDWLSGFNPASSPFSFSAQRLVPWHEGARIKEIVQYTQAQVFPVWGTKVKKIGQSWYAPDEKGIFRFPVPEDKIYYYPTNFVLDQETVIINDTHGINTIAWDAEGADLVVGCGDHPGKIEAAYYLAQKGLNVYMPADRFLSLLIGIKTKGKIIGTAPVKKTDDGAVIGNQPVVFDIHEPIVVCFSETSEDYALPYYDTPLRYFRALEEYLNLSLNIIPVRVPADGRADVVVTKARKLGVKIIGIRIRYPQEHDALAAWLRENKERRAILFHSAIYDPGYRLFFEFPDQTSFGDINPIFQEAIEEYEEEKII